MICVPRKSERSPNKSQWWPTVKMKNVLGMHFKGTLLKLLSNLSSAQLHAVSNFNILHQLWGKNIDCIRQKDSILAVPSTVQKWDQYTHETAAGFLCCGSHFEANLRSSDRASELWFRVPSKIPPHAIASRAQLPIMIYLLIFFNI